MPVAASFRCQDYVDNALARLRGPRRRWGWTRRSRGASARPTCCSRSAGAWARSRPTATRSCAPARRRSGSSTCIPTRASSAPSTSPSSGSSPASRRSRPRPRARAGGRGAASGLLEAARAEYERNLRETRELPGRAADVRGHGGAARAPGPDAILTNGAGNFSVWAHRFYEFHRYPTQLAPRSGSMGYGVPAAVAAKAVHPDRPVVCIAGDGDFLMTGQELATAVQEDLADRRARGQQRDVRHDPHAPGAPLSRAASSPPTCATPTSSRYARAFGAHGALVERSEDFAGALDEALECGRAGAPRAARRPAGDHAAPDPRRDPHRRPHMTRTRDPRAGLAPPISHYTDAVIAGDTLYVSGIVPVDAEGKLVGRGRRRPGAPGVREHGPRARGGGRGAGRRRQGHRLPARHRRPRRRSTRCARSSSARRGRRARSSRSAASPSKVRSGDRRAVRRDLRVTRSDPTATRPHRRRLEQRQRGGARRRDGAGVHARDRHRRVRADACRRLRDRRAARPRSAPVSVEASSRRPRLRRSSWRGPSPTARWRAPSSPARRSPGPATPALRSVALTAGPLAPAPAGPRD